MQFLNLTWLWGLTGLLIPIAIHLLSRKEGKVIRIGSIRHFEETSTRQFRNIRLNELVLLALRCLLITFVVLLLSGLSYTNSKSEDIKWMVMERGMKKEKDFKTLIDSLEQNGFELRWLEKDFPLLKDSSIITHKLNYGSLIESLKKVQAKQIVVLSYNYANRFKGKRTTLPNNIQWISKSPQPEKFTVSTTLFSSDSVLVRKGNSNGDRTMFANEAVGINSLTAQDKMLIQNQDTISILIASDSEFGYDKNIMIAALKAVDETLPCVLKIKSSDISKLNDDQADWIIWLSENAIPENMQTKNLAFNKKKFGNKIITLSDKGWLLTQRLDQENAIENNLTLQLASILLPKEQAQQTANKFDRRTLPEKELWSSAPSQIANTFVIAETNNAIPFLFALILVVLLAERIIAFKRNQ